MFVNVVIYERKFFMTQIITKIEAQKRPGRFNVYINNEYTLAISERVLIEYHIFKGQEVDEQLINQLKKADSVAKLYSKALNYLAHNLRTIKEVQDKLAQSSDDQGQIDEVINQLIDQQLLDDQKYADSYVRTIVNQAKNGPKWISNQLTKRGVTLNQINEALANFYPEAVVIENAEQVVVKEMQHLKKEAFKMAVSKTRQLLLRRGFANNQIEIALQIIDPADYPTDPTVIDKLATKYLKRYAKYGDYEQIQRTKRALYQKGYSMDEINSSLNKIN